MKKRRKPKKQVRSLASARIEHLWEQSRYVASERPDRARLWMSSARKIAQKARMKIPSDISRSICKECGTVWIPGNNCRVRVRNNRSTHMTVTCLVCGNVRRFPVIKQG
ncbi:MAG: ribonuclease P protein component 4 [Candidatus Thorarchaeota archaeon]